MTPHSADDRISEARAGGATARWQEPGVENVLLHGEATVSASTPLRVVTPGDAWAFALSVPLLCPTDSSLLVEVSIKILRGSVGLSCTSETHERLTDETFIQEGPAVCSVQLLTEPGDVFLLVRNGPERSVATFELFGLRCTTPADVRAYERAPALQPAAQWHRYYGNLASSAAEKIRSRDYRRLSAPARYAWLEGLTFIARPDDQLSRALYVSGLYEPNTAVVIRGLLKPGAVFVDVGAHVGVFTMLASRWVGVEGRVISFEPSPRERSRLVEHVELNQLKNVTVVSAAVSDCQGDTMLKVAVDGFGGLNTIGSAFAYDVPVQEELPVPVTTLDAAIEARHVGRVDVVKLDIEGAEYAALRGAASVLERWRPALVLELFSVALKANGASREELNSLLQHAGYRLFAIDDETAVLHPLQSLVQVDEQNIVALPQERTDQKAD